MVLVPPQSRPSGGTMLGNHEARIRILERALLRVLGIRFNETNEELALRYLIITANDHIPASDTSILLRANLDGVGDGGDFEIISENILSLTADNSIANAAPVITNTTPGASEISGAAGETLILAAAATREIQDSGNNSIFEVREDGTVHIKTGESIIADL